MVQLTSDGRAWNVASDSDPKALRQLFGNFLTGVTVVACRDQEGKTRAFTANSFTSVSLEPPLVLVCIASTAVSADVFIAANEFSINILSDAHEDVSRGLATGGPAKDALLNTLDYDGIPFLRDGLAVIHCKKDRLVEIGDHKILVGQVVRHRTSVGRPLGYFCGSYVRPNVVMPRQAAMHP